MNYYKHIKINTNNLLNLFIIFNYVHERHKLLLNHAAIFYLSADVRFNS